ncbi:MAG: maleylpyruvate isomerase N-terminal domain-containing protein [Nakamurella sp.]
MITHRRWPGQPGSATHGVGPREHNAVRRASPAEWTVADVLGHLGSGAEIGLAGLDAALAGAAAPGSDFNQGVWAGGERDDAAGTGSRVLRSNEALVTRYEGLDEQTGQTQQIKIRQGSSGWSSPTRSLLSTPQGLRMRLRHYRRRVGCGWWRAGSVRPTRRPGVDFRGGLTPAVAAELPRFLSGPGS